MASRQAGKIIMINIWKQTLFLEYIDLLKIAMTTTRSKYKSYRIINR